MMKGKVDQLKQEELTGVKQVLQVENFKSLTVTYYHPINYIIHQIWSAYC